MDKQLRAEIVAEVRKAMMTYSERWVTEDQLCEYVGTLTKRWLKSHGQLFNRTRVEWDDADGHHTQGWIYPLYEILDWINSGKIKELTES